MPPQGPTKPDDGVRARTDPALRRLEPWCNPRDRLAASPRPSRGIARRSEDADPTRCDGHGFRRPARRLHALRVSTSRAWHRDRSRAGPPCASASLRRSVAAPPHRRGVPGGPTRPTMLPPLGFCAPRHMPGRWTRAPRASRPEGVPRPRFGTSFAAPTTVPPGPLAGTRASTGFALRGVLLAPVRPPLGDRCPPAVARVGSPRSLRCVRTRPAPGPCSRCRARSVLRPLRARSVDASLRFVPPERSPPSSCVALWVAHAPPPRVGRDDVLLRLRLEVFRSDGVGWPLSGLPALLGSATLRPSRRHEGRAEGELMVSPRGEG